MVLLSEDHPLAKKEAISFQDLAHEDILMYEKGTSYVEVRLEREFAARNITWNIQHYFSNFSTIYDSSLTEFRNLVHHADNIADFKRAARSGHGSL